MRCREKIPKISKIMIFGRPGGWIIDGNRLRSLEMRYSRADRKPYTAFVKGAKFDKKNKMV